MDAMELSIIIVSWNTKDLLRDCLHSVYEEIRGLEAEVFVVDNNSPDQSALMVGEEFPWVKLLANKSNRGFAAANNQAFILAAGRKILLLNPDTKVRPNSLKALVQFLDQNPSAGVVAPQLLNTDGSIQRSCRSFPTFLNMSYELLGLSRLFPNVHRFRHYKMLDWNHDDQRQVDQPEGACLMVRREVLDQVGTLDEGFFMLFEEVDWCYRIKQAGWQIWFLPSAQVVHHYGQSIKQVKSSMILSSHRGLYRFWRKHYRRNRWYMDLPAYTGLMLLAYVRIVSHRVKAIRTSA